MFYVGTVGLIASVAMFRCAQNLNLSSINSGDFNSELTGRTVMVMSTYAAHCAYQIMDQHVDDGHTIDQQLANRMLSTASDVVHGMSFVTGFELLCSVARRR